VGNARSPNLGACQTLRQSYTNSIAQLLGLGSQMRSQNPTLCQTAGQDPRWYIRPYVDHLQADHSIKRVKERIYLGSCAEMTKRQAQAEAAKAMAMLNDRRRAVLAQINFAQFLDEYTKKYVRKPDHLAASTQEKYTRHIENHIRPAFGRFMMAEITTQRIEDWLAEKAMAGLSWATRMDLRNILSGIFTQASRWGYWREKNPATEVCVGKQRAVREKRKLTDQQTRQLLDALPEDVRLICMVALFCTLRISEVLGLQWKHVDWAQGLLLVRQRYYRGDLDEPKTRKAKRDVPLGYLADLLREVWPGEGHEEDFIFAVKTARGLCRDDRDINHYFLRKAAKALGLYWRGFGFHAFRREAITAISATAGVGQAMNLAGHTKADMSQEYTLVDHSEQERAVRAFQERILGPHIHDATVGELREPRSATIGPEWAKWIEGSDERLAEIVAQILSLDGGPGRTRICDLYRVKVAL
jgi:integrase